MGALKVAGTYLGIERRNGTFDGDDGKPVSYDFSVVGIAAGVRSQEVRLPKGVHVAPWAVGDYVEVDVTVPPDVKVRLTEAALAAAGAPYLAAVDEA